LGAGLVPPALSDFAGVVSVDPSVFFASFFGGVEDSALGFPLDE
jgi:hypothetical protein